MPSGRRDHPPLPTGPLTTAQGAAVVGRRALAGPAYRRLDRGVYLPAGVTLDHGLLVRAVRARLGDRPVLVGVSAAWALGCRLADPGTPVHVMVGSGARSTRYCVPHRGTVPDDQVVATRLGAATSLCRTAVDLARGFGGTEAASVAERVARLDSLVRHTALTASMVCDAVSATAQARGVVGARQVAQAVRDGVDSPRETELRLLVVGAGLPEPVVQCVVRDSSGGFVARLDLGWPGHRCGLEYDGAVHREPRRHSRDLIRHNKLRASGWRVLQVDAWSLAHPEELLRQLRSLLAAPPGRSTSA